MSQIRQRLENSSIADAYSRCWISIVSSLPPKSAQTFLVSLLISISWSTSLSRAPLVQRNISREAYFLRKILGPLGKNEQDKERWDLVVAVVLGRPWPEELGRALVCWVAGESTGWPDLQGELKIWIFFAGILTTRLILALEILLWRILDLWTSPQYVKHSLLSQHKCEDPEHPLSVHP
jgi:telomere length regulation protein